MERLKGLTNPHFYILLAPHLRRVQSVPHPVNPNLISKGYVLTMPDGTRTEFRHKDHDEDLLNSSVFAGYQTFRSFDGSQMQLREQMDGVIVYFKDGTSIKFAGPSASPSLLPQWMRDTNINYEYGSTNQPDTLVDTLGRTVERHINGTTTTIKVKDQDGQYLVYTLAGPTDNDNLQTLTLPNGLQYAMEFTDWQLSEPCDFYDSLGQERPADSYAYAKGLTKITYPSGGYTRYEWEPYRHKNSRRNETDSNYRLSAKYLKADSAEGPPTTYTGPVPDHQIVIPDFGSGVQTTRVIRPDQSYSDHTFVWHNAFGPAKWQLGTIPLETKVESYSTRGTMLQSIEKIWETDFGNPRVTKVVTARGTLSKKVEYEYDEDGYGRDNGSKRITNNNIEEVREYDWGTFESALRLLRRTTRSYLTSTDYGIGALGKHILDRLTQEIVYEPDPASQEGSK